MTTDNLITTRTRAEGLTAREMMCQLIGLDYVAFMLWINPVTGQRYRLHHMPLERYRFEEVQS